MSGTNSAFGSWHVFTYQLTPDGGDGDDDLIAGDGNDILLGSAGDDVLLGGPGLAILDGSLGDNIVLQD